MLSLIRRRNFYIMLAMDCLLSCAAFFLAFFFRFEFSVPDPQWRLFTQTLPVLIPIKIVCFLACGMYRGMWRYTSLRDLYHVLNGVVVSSLLLTAWVAFSYQLGGYARSIFIIDGLLSLIFLGGIRLLVRVYFVKRGSIGARFFDHFPAGALGKKRLIIAGAGNFGEKVLREIRENPRMFYQVVGFVDDDPCKRGLTIHGVPVLGPISDLGNLLAGKNIEELLIAMSSVKGEVVRRIVEFCKDSGVSYKTLPSIGELIDGRVSIKTLRDVRYEDLLGREPVDLDLGAIMNYLKDQTIVISGAGGSIGSEICRQLIRFNPGRLVLVDAAESNLYNIQMELKHQVGYLDYAAILGNVQDRLLIDRVFERYRPDVVIHAAAYKHVPMLERNPWEAVSNNIVGSKTLMDAAVAARVKKFIMISTDKAVRPTNVMGASKRVCEMMLHLYRGSPTRFMAVRFGNVVGSSGSVVPLFREQIARGGPVTVTHPEVTRFFMTIPEACQLVLQAGALGNGGEIFLLDMGVPLRILDIARDLIRLSGKEPEKDIRISFIGLRQGEKLYEELITQGEGIVKTTHDKIMVLYSDYSARFDETFDFAGYMRMQIENLVRAAEAKDGRAIRTQLKECVPEYTADDGECVI